MSDGYAYFSMDDFGLVPSDLFAGTDVPFIDLILVELGYGPAYGLSAEPAVREYIRNQPGLYSIIRELRAKVPRHTPHPGRASAGVGGPGWM